MAKRRTGKHDEVLLIPFLDILCSLIGVLILIIVVLCVAQTQKVKGRTKQELELAQKYQSLIAQQKELEKTSPSLKAKLAELTKLQEDLAAKQLKVVELRKRLTLSAEEEKKNKEQAAQIQKQVEALLAQVEAVAKSIPPLQAENEKLKKLLAERQKKPTDQPPSLVVRPSGSGSGKNQKLFFVEASGAGLLIHKSKTEKVRVATAAVGADKDYNAFLESVKKAGGNAQLIFLVRKDGWWTYQRAAGWAEQSFDLLSSKLPLPGSGTVDLSLFDKP